MKKQSILYLLVIIIIIGLFIVSLCFKNNKIDNNYTASLYLYSTIAQSISTIVGFIIASIFAILPAMSSKTNPAYGPSMRILQNNNIFKEVVYLSFILILISILSLSLYNLFGPSKIVYSIITYIFNPLSLILLIFTVFKAIALITKYLPAYNSPFSNINIYDINKFVLKDDLIDFLCALILYSCYSYVSKIDKDTLIRIINSYKNKVFDGKELLLNTLMGETLDRTHKYLIEYKLHKDKEVIANLIKIMLDLIPNVDIYQKEENNELIQINILLTIISSFKDNLEDNKYLLKIIDDKLSDINSEIFKSERPDDIITAIETNSKFISDWIIILFQLISINKYLFSLGMSEFFKKLYNNDNIIISKGLFEPDIIEKLKQISELSALGYFTFIALMINGNKSEYEDNGNLLYNPDDLYIIHYPNPIYTKFDNKINLNKLLINNILYNFPESIRFVYMFYGKRDENDDSISKMPKQQKDEFMNYIGRKINYLVIKYLEEKHTWMNFSIDNLSELISRKYKLEKIRILVGAEENPTNKSTVYNDLFLSTVKKF